MVAKANPALPPNQPRGNRHAEIEGRPNRAENPVRRSPTWFREGRIPSGNLRCRDRPTDSSSGKAEDEEDDEAEIGVSWGHGVAE